MPPHVEPVDAVLENDDSYDELFWPLPYTPPYYSILNPVWRI